MTLEQFLHWVLRQPGVKLTVTNLADKVLVELDHFSNGKLTRVETMLSGPVDVDKLSSGINGLVWEMKSKLKEV